MTDEGTISAKQIFDASLDLIAIKDAEIATRDATIAELVTILAQTRAIVADGAMNGFLPLEGDWAERLFVNQNAISRVIKARAALDAKP